MEPYSKSRYLRADKTIKLFFGCSVAFAVIFSVIFFFNKIYAQDLFTSEAGYKTRITSIFLFIWVTSIILIADHSRRFRKLDDTQNWLVSALNANMIKNKDWEKLEANKSHLESGKIKDAIDLSHTNSHWPWGDHHTETLGFLEEAANRYWKLYDPADPTTAPTNDMVATWLKDVKGISGEKARAIASMLRPDGLPTGPRR